MTAKDRVQSHYLGESGRRYHAGFDIPPVALDWVARLRAAKFEGAIAREHVLLEYGVGAGWNIAALACRRRLGFDIGDHLAPRVAQLGIEFVSDTKALSDASVDVVICHHVLEHVIAPPETLGEIGRLLVAGGSLLLCVPFERERRYRFFQRGEINHHLYSWNVQTLGNLVEEAGFLVTSAGVGQYGYDRFASAWAVRLGLGETGFRLIRQAVHLVRPGREVRIVATKAPTPGSPPTPSGTRAA
jgi:SAM-dependent methyltransferase